jgi:putative hydrolase of the HAD superfamily
MKPAVMLRPQVTRTLLFDLDETLVVEEPAAAAALRATAEFARRRHTLDAATLAEAARGHARELWRAAPTYRYCLRIGVSSWEGLWCRFEGDDASVRALRTWAPSYRRESWKLALADQGVRDDALAEELGETFGTERRQRHEAFADVVGALTSARQSCRLGLITNGASCLQREKLAASGLAGFFDAVVISGDLGVGKPDASVFRHALSLLDASPQATVMIGDSIARDIDGAIAAGLHAIWLNRLGHPRPDDRPALVEIATLDALTQAIGE